MYIMPHVYVHELTRVQVVTIKGKDVITVLSSIATSPYMYTMYCVTET